MEKADIHSQKRLNRLSNTFYSALWLVAGGAVLRQKAIRPVWKLSPLTRNCYSSTTVVRGNYFLTSTVDASFCCTPGCLTNNKKNWSLLGVCSVNGQQDLCDQSLLPSIMADRAPKSNAYNSSQQQYDAVGRNSDYSYPATNASGLGHRYPHPVTAYGNNASPAPASGAGTVGRHLPAEGKLPPPNEEAGAKHRDVADATNVRGADAAGPAGPAAAAAGGQRRPPDLESAAHRDGGPRPHPGGRETRRGGENGHGESVGQAQDFLRRTAQAQPASPASSRAQASSARGTSASSGSANPQSRHPHAPIPPGVPKSTTPPPAAATGAAAHPAAEACVNLEAVGDPRLGEPAEARRAMTCEEAEGLSAFMGCPLTDCPMHRAQGIGEGWMARHLA